MSRKYHYYLESFHGIKTQPEWFTFETPDFPAGGGKLLAIATVASHQTIGGGASGFDPGGSVEAAILGVRYYDNDGRPERDYRLITPYGHFWGDNVASLRLGLRVFNGWARANFLILID